MTRENKLALVVGFALILFVGILVSDHFSTARQQEAANLVPVSDPLVQSRRDNADLLRFERVPTVSMPDVQARPETAKVSLPPDQARALPYQNHTVRNGETLTVICRRHYHDASLVDDLARFNGITDKNKVFAGDRIKLPPAETLVRGAPPSARPNRPTTVTAPPPPVATNDRSTYTVQSGDVLSVIAQEVMGSAKRWRDLYEFNRDVINDPDRIRAGTVLKIPH